MINFVIVFILIILVFFACKSIFKNRNKNGCLGCPNAQNCQKKDAHNQ